MLLSVASIDASESDAVDYATDIKPLLSEKCYSCHGVLKQEADLRLETLALMLDHGVILPGEPDDSELILRVTAEGDQRMPPPHEGSALTPDQVKLLKQWIRAGAPAPDEAAPAAPTEHWAFQPIVRPELPSDSQALESVHPIDALLQAKRRSKNLNTVGPAPRSLLIRRLYLDLIGLPPTAEQLRDTRSWEAIVDELLASPAHGERWARHWMDVWRYTDWYGLGAQVRYSQKHIWHWRDWIVRSLCEDKGYDRMIQEMLAGDELAPDDPDAVAGTGFLARNYYLFNRTTWLDSTIEHTGKAFLGLTLNCAKCHDHKYDPISQLDYYRFRAILEPHQIRLDPLPGITDFEQDALPRAFDDHIDRPTYLHRRGDPKNPDESRVIEPGVPEILDDFAASIEPINLPATAYAPGTRDYVQQAKLAEAEQAVEDAQKQLANAEAQLASTTSDDSQPSNETSPWGPIIDDFDAPDDERWKLIGDGWKYRDGSLHQTQAGREEQMARLLPRLPNDFEFVCDYTTTGGTTYKSVTFRFDQSGNSDTSNFVYTSAHAPGPKVHVAYKRDGQTTYPPQGRAPRKIEIGKRYRIRVAVRDTLVNVWLDDEFVVAYRLPDRHTGFFSLSGFDATVAFDRIEIRSLSPDVTLQPAGSENSAAADPRLAVTLAEHERSLAQARLAAVKATIAADSARYVEHSSEETVAQLTQQAAAAQLRVNVAQAKLNIVQETTDEKKRQAAEQQLATTEKRLAELNAENATYASLRGSRKALESPADKEPDYPAVYHSQSSGRRLALARWMVSPQNPLTARVAVNHVWMRHFGTPLVDSVFDFGLRSPRPLQAELLDYLAAEFMASGWSFKHLHRLIVTSQAYQLDTAASSDSSAHARQVDPNNEYYWRSHSRRMEAQVVRDSLLHLAGKLDPTLGGPPVDAGDAVARRSIYMKHSRDQQNKFLSMFDDADILQCYRRSESIVPQQALALSNSKVSIEMSAQIAGQIATAKALPTRHDFIDEVFFVVLGRPATSPEIESCEQYFDQLAALPSYQQLGDEERERRMRTRLVHAIVNHNDFVTIR